MTCNARLYADAVAASDDPQPCYLGHLGCAVHDLGSCSDELLTACRCPECRPDYSPDYDDAGPRTGR